MKTYLNVFDYPVDKETLSLIKSLGYNGLRRDIQSPSEISLILEECNSHNFELILLLNAPPPTVVEWMPEIKEKIGNYPLKIEVGNEWDGRFYANPLAAQMAWDDGLVWFGDKMITGGISSLGSKALGWLRVATKNRTYPNIGFHPYRTTQVPDPTILTSIQSLRNISPNSLIWNTECGWHTCKSKINCFKSVQFNDEQVATFLSDDLRYHHMSDVESYTIYQLNDGPSSHYEDHFGIRRIDNTLKPSAYVLTGYGSSLAKSYWERE